MSMYVICTKMHGIYKLACSRHIQLYDSLGLNEVGGLLLNYLRKTQSHNCLQRNFSSIKLCFEFTCVYNNPLYVTMRQLSILYYKAFLF